MTKQTPEQQIDSLLNEFEIRKPFPEACHAEVQHWLDHTGIDDPTLAQWQGLAFVTIDNPDSRDLDQALLIEQNEDASFRVRYALADAAFYVPTTSALFEEALKRGVTYYTPTHSIPMLPRALSEGLVSLNPNTDRRALVFDMQLADNGSVLNCSIVRARIQSQAKLSYESVQHYLDSDNTHAYHSQPYAQSLSLLEVLGELLMKQAVDRHVVPFNRVETVIEIDDGQFSMRRRHRVRTEKYNEQISLLCNMQGAQLLHALLPDNDELQAIFRVHDAPLAKRQKALRTLINNFATLENLGEQWHWNKPQSLAEFVTGLPNDKNMSAKRAAIERQILVSNRASEFRAEPGRHHALAASSYARFSSPMREIVGIFTHRELLQVLMPEQAEPSTTTQHTEHDIALQKQIIETANIAKQTQKKLDKAIEFLAMQAIFTQDLNSAMAPLREGVIMGFRRERLYVACEPFASDLKISKQDLQAQHQCDYEFNELQALANTPRHPNWTLGQKVKVQVQSYDTEKRHFVLGLFT